MASLAELDARLRGTVLPQLTQGIAPLRSRATNLLQRHRRRHKPPLRRRGRGSRGTGASAPPRLMEEDADGLWRRPSAAEREGRERAMRPTSASSHFLRGRVGPGPGSPPSPPPSTPPPGGPTSVSPSPATLAYTLAPRTPPADRFAFLAEATATPAPPSASASCASVGALAPGLGTLAQAFLSPDWCTRAHVLGAGPPAHDATVVAMADSSESGARGDGEGASAEATADGAGAESGGSVHASRGDATGQAASEGTAADEPGITAARGDDAATAPPTSGEGCDAATAAHAAPDTAAPSVPSSAIDRPPEAATTETLPRPVHGPAASTQARTQAPTRRVAAQYFNDKVSASAQARSLRASSSSALPARPAARAPQRATIMRASVASSSASSVIGSQVPPRAPLSRLASGRVAALGRARSRAPVAETSAAAPIPPGATDSTASRPSRSPVAKTTDQAGAANQARTGRPAPLPLAQSAQTAADDAEVKTRHTHAVDERRRQATEAPTGGDVDESLLVPPPPNHVLARTPVRPSAAAAVPTVSNGNADDNEGAPATAATPAAAAEGDGIVATGPASSEDDAPSGCGVADVLLGGSPLLTPPRLSTIRDVATTIAPVLAVEPIAQKSSLPQVPPPPSLGATATLARSSSLPSTGIAPRAASPPTSARSSPAAATGGAAQGTSSPSSTGAPGSISGGHMTSSATTPTSHSRSPSWSHSRSRSNSHSPSSSARGTAGAPPPPGDGAALAPAASVVTTSTPADGAAPTPLPTPVDGCAYPPSAGIGAGPPTQPQTASGVHSSTSPGSGDGTSGSHHSTPRRACLPLVTPDSPPPPAALLQLFDAPPPPPPAPASSAALYSGVPQTRPSVEPSGLDPGGT